MKKLLTIASIIALYSSASFAKDQDDMIKSEPKPPHHEKMHDKMFGEVDKNSDGEITKKEWLDFHSKKFSEADANKDGKITKEEMKKVHEKIREKWDEIKEKMHSIKPSGENEHKKPEHEKND